MKFILVLVIQEMKCTDEIGLKEEEVPEYLFQAMLPSWNTNTGDLVSFDYGVYIFNFIL